MAHAKPSGLARFTRQAQAEAPTAAGPPARPVDPAQATAAPAGGAAKGASRGAPKPKLVGVYVMPDGHRQLKVEAAKRGATVSDLVREALNAWFANEQLPPLA